MAADDTEPRGATECTSRECRDLQFRKQMRENSEVLQESASILHAVEEKLRRAAESLSTYGEPPLSDLERHSS